MFYRFNRIENSRYVETQMTESARGLRICAQLSRLSGRNRSIHYYLTKTALFKVRIKLSEKDKKLIAKFLQSSLAFLKLT